MDLFSTGRCIENDNQSTMPFNCFNCKGRPNISNERFVRSEQNFNNSILNDDENQSDRYVFFGNSFHKGNSLVYDIPILFRMAKKHLLSLSSVVRDQYKTFRSHEQSNCKPINFSDIRHQISEFLIFLRDGLQRMKACESYNWLMESHEKKIELELNNLYSTLGQFHHLSETIIQHALSSSDCKNNIYYHLYHCHLDIRWFQLSLLSELPKSKDTFKHSLHNALNDLVQLARNRFKKLQLKDLHFKDALLCDCTYDFLVLLQYLINKQQLLYNSDNFWQYFNTALTNVNYVDCDELIFRLWLLNSLQQSEKSTSIDLKDSGLVSILKEFLNNEPNEIQLKLSVCLLENIVISSLNTEPVIVLWEYFHKRLNSTFYSSDMKIQNIACISKNGSELLIQMTNLFSAQQNDLLSNYNSFQLFQRLLGLHLQNIKYNSKDWNQIKGRIFSKFSPSKLMSFNDIGFYNFTTLFLALSIMSDDTSQIALKYQHLVKLISESKLDPNTRSTYWKGTVAFLILHSQRNTSMTAYGTSLSDTLNATSQEHITIYLDGLKEVFIFSESLAYGQHTLIGSWFGNYLSTIKPSENNEVLQTVLLILEKLKKVGNDQSMPFPRENEIFILYDSLYTYLLPFLKKSCLTVDCGTTVADIAATFTIISSKPAFSDTKVMLFNFFVVNQGINIKLLNRYLSTIIKENVIANVHGYNSLALIKAWLHSSMLITNWTFNETMIITQFVSNISEIKELFKNSGNDLETSVDPFITFLDLLSIKYHHNQDVKFRQKMSEKVSDYFYSIKIWVNILIKQHKQNDEIYRLYMVIGYVFEKISPLIYVKGKPNTILQELLDSMLLGVNLRSPNTKMHPSVITALLSSLHRYFIGLFRLNPKTDLYIARCLRELISLYFPKILVGIKSSDELPLLKFFEEKPDNEIPERALLLELLVSTFLSKRHRTPDSSVAQVLEYINSIIKISHNNKLVILSIIQHTLMRICSVSMFCEETNICKRITNEIINTLINLSVSQSNDEIKNEVMSSLNTLCEEHLAFSSKLIFEFFDYMITISPDFVTCFLPKLVAHIEKVEWKRGIGSDYTLRKGLERIQIKLGKI
ncbi:protein MMS22-like [Metopolophium dirhodum]|uniref:protein MMS22-like n=1 Tax=Metopolophium dirhodum TaxID=44670 RepID=UPI00298FEF95|nr:protein MMS22-like [Metopolophium dirhodum]